MPPHHRLPRPGNAYPSLTPKPLKPSVVIIPVGSYTSVLKLYTDKS